MVFSSTVFLTLFLPIILILYVLLQERLRTSFLVLASLFFYAWGEPKAILCMVLMIACNWSVARILPPPHQTTSNENERGAFLLILFKNRSLVLSLAVLVNLSTLFIYKYLDFTVLNINSLFNTAWKLPGIALPVGISFYCFQCISYIVDVYRGMIKPQQSPTLFALYVAFFPALIAGPIVRYIDVEKDLANRKLHWDNWSHGLQRFAVGLAKKVLIADPMGFMADKVFSGVVTDIATPWAWIGIFCYALQIFYDFSAYSDMAIGLARIFNLHVPENFKFPYSALSIQDFWRRWHISLSSWLRDYVYIPLGGSRVSKARTLVNVWIIFILCGLWHGAAWTFVVWGIWHGLGLTIERLGFGKVLKSLPRIVQNCWVWCFVLVGWVFFRSPDLEYAVEYLKAMFLGNEASFWLHQEAFSALTISWLLMLLVGFGFAYEWPNKWMEIRKESTCSIIFTVIIFALAYAFATTSSFSPFIYFRF